MGCIETKLVRRNKYFREQRQLEWYINLHTLNSVIQTASFLGGIISVLYVLLIQLQAPLWHSPLQPLGTLGRSQGSPLPMCIRFSYSKRMLSPAKTNDVTFTLLFLQRNKKYSQRELVGQGNWGSVSGDISGNSVGGWRWSSTEILGNKALCQLHRNSMLQHEKQSIVFQKNAIIF